MTTGELHGEPMSERERVSGGGSHKGELSDWYLKVRRGEGLRLPV